MMVALPCDYDRRLRQATTTRDYDTRLRHATTTRDYDTRLRQATTTRDFHTIANYYCCHCILTGRCTVVSSRLIFRAACRFGLMSHFKRQTASPIPTPADQEVYQIISQTGLRDANTKRDSTYCAWIPYIWRVVSLASSSRAWESSPLAALKIKHV